MDQPGYQSLLDGPKQKASQPVITHLDDVCKNQIFQGQEKEGLGALGEDDGDSESSEEGDEITQTQTQKQAQEKKPAPAKQAKRGSTRAKKGKANSTRRKRGSKKGSKASKIKLESRASQLSADVPSFRVDSLEGSNVDDRMSFGTEFDVFWNIPVSQSSIRTITPVYPRSRSEQGIRANLPLGENSLQY